MARAFDNASSQYLIHTGVPVSSYPCTLACWAYLTDKEYARVGISLGHSSDAAEEIQISFRGGAYQDIIARKRNELVQLASAGDPPINTWNHWAGTFDQSSIYAYLNGTPGAETSTSLDFPTLDTTVIGCHYLAGSASNYMSGSIAEAAIWTVVLTPAEIQILAAGYSPLLVRPQNLVAYWPLIRDTDDDIVGGYSMTPVNSPTVAAHPRVFYPGMPHVGYAAAAIAALRIPRHPAAYYGGPTVF